MAVRLLALRAGRPLPPGRFLVLISVRGWVDSRAIVWLEGLGQLKNPMTLSVFEPATFRLVAECLNQLRYRLPQAATGSSSIIAWTIRNHVCVRTKRFIHLYALLCNGLYWSVRTNGIRFIRCSCVQTFAVKKNTVLEDVEVESGRIPPNFRRNLQLPGSVSTKKPS
jgi:hypothetical protein